MWHDDRQTVLRKKAMGMLRLYDYAASGNCYKVRLLLAQLGRPYERISLDIFDGDTLTDEYAAKNPARSTPLLELKDGAFLAESNAILVYLAHGTPLMPSDRLGVAQVVRWLIFEQTDVMMTMGGLRFRLLTGRFTADSPDAVRRKAGAQDALRLLDQHLLERSFLLGQDYTVADIAVYAYSHVAHEAGITMGDYPAVQAWFGRVQAQHGYINDLEPYPGNARAGMGRSIYG
jgi:glutathione S-transferase